MRTTQPMIYTKRQTMKTTTDLLRMNAAVGNKLDTAAPDHAAMRFLLQARRAVRAELEARHAALEAARQS
jgi:hypothetical protein